MLIPGKFIRRIQRIMRMGFNFSFLPGLGDKFHVINKNTLTLAPKSLRASALLAWEVEQAFKKAAGRTPKQLFPSVLDLLLPSVHMQWVGHWSLPRQLWVQHCCLTLRNELGAEGWLGGDKSGCRERLKRPAFLQSAPSICSNHTLAYTHSTWHKFLSKVH